MVWPPGGGHTRPLSGASATRESRGDTEILPTRYSPTATTVVIDAHVHHFDLRRFRYPWLDDPEFDALRSDYLPADYRTDLGRSGRVEGSVQVQAEVDHATDPVRETEWVLELAQRAGAEGLPGPIACVVYADLRAADLDDVLPRQTSSPLTRGVRQEAWFDPTSKRADIPPR